MNPSQVSAELRRIAAAINNSQNPSRERVLGDLRRVLASMDETAGIEIDASMDHEAGMVGSLMKSIIGFGAAASICSMLGCESDKKSTDAINQAMEYCLDFPRGIGDSPVSVEELDECSDMIEKSLKRKGFQEGSTGLSLSYSPGYLNVHQDGEAPVRIKLDTLQ